jgi:antitoxin MazE
VYHNQKGGMMSITATVTKWGNAQGIRLPVAFCRQLGLSVGDKVSIELDKQRIILCSEPLEKYTLKSRKKTWDGSGSPLTDYEWGPDTGKEKLFWEEDE